MNVSENIIETDVLIIGGGTAGCFAAIKAREQGLDVTIVDKAYAGKSGASIAAAGWWAVFNPEWGHTLDAAMNFGNAMLDYLLNREWNEIVYKESWQTFQDIIAWGVEFPTTLDQLKDYHNKQLIRGRTNEDGHFAPFDDPNTPFTLVPLRHRKTTPYLRKQAHKVGVRIIDRIVVTDLLKKDGKVIGAVGFPTDSYDLYIFKAKATVLSAGGSSYKPPGHWINSVTGDAEGMAYRAGAELGGKEFPDGHMTQGPYPGWKSGEMYPVYYYYTDAEGKEITKAYGTVANPFTIHEGKGPVYHDFDAATAKDLEALQEYIHKRGNPIELPRAGIDPGRGGKFHMMGGAAAGHAVEQTSGIWPVNTDASSSLPGLYSAGDACCSWSAAGGLTPAAVTGRRAGSGAAKYALQIEKPVIDQAELTRLKEVMYAPAERKGGFDPRWVTQLVQNTVMPYFIMFIKHGERLKSALTTVEFLRDNLIPKLVAKDPHELRLAHETRNMTLAAEIMLRSSLYRTESRGVHYREDYPGRDDPTWLAWVKLKEEQGKMKLWRLPIPEKWRPDLSIPYEKRYPVRFPGEQT